MMSRNECSIEHDIQRAESKICLFLDLLAAFKTQLVTFAEEHPTYEACHLNACPIHKFLVRLEPTFHRMGITLEREFSNSDDALRNFRQIRSGRDNRYHHGYARSYRGPPSQSTTTDHHYPRLYTDQSDQFDPPDIQNGTLVPSNSFNSGRILTNPPRNDARPPHHPPPPPDQVQMPADPPKQEPTTSAQARKNYASTPLLAPELPQLSPSLLRGPMTSRQAMENGATMPLELSSITIETSRNPQMTQSVLISIDGGGRSPASRAKSSLIKTVSPPDAAVQPKQAPNKQESLPAFSPPPVLSNANTQNPPARPPLPSVPPSKKHVDPIPEFDICLTYRQNGMKLIKMSDNERYKVYISHSESPSIFWVHLQESASILESLVKKVNSFYNSNTKSGQYRLKRIHKDKFYAAKYSLDEKWYRARILNVNDEGTVAKVYYVDYGNTETLGISSLRLLTNEFLMNDAFAIPMSLYQTMPIDQHNFKWPDSTNESFQSLLNNRAAEILIRVHDDWPLPFCKMKLKLAQDQSQTEYDTAKYLVESKMAQIKPTSEIVKLMINVIYEIYDHYNFGSFASRRNAISDENLNGPITPSQSDWGAKSSVTKPMISSNNAAATGREERTSSIYTYKITDLPTRTINLDERKQVAFEFSNSVHSPSSFYIYLKNDQHTKYHELQETLGKFYLGKEAFLREASLKNMYNFVFEDALCVCKSDKCSKFVRARVTDASSMTAKQKDMRTNLVTVDLIDYGSSETVMASNLFPMFPEFSQLPAYAIHAKLNLIQPLDAEAGWHPGAVQFFRDVINFSAYYLGSFHNCKPEAEFAIDVTTQLAMIVIYDDVDSTLNDLLIEKKFAQNILDDLVDEDGYQEVHMAEYLEEELAEEDLNDHENLQLPPPPYPTHPSNFYEQMHMRESARLFLSRLDSHEQISEFRELRLKQYVKEQSTLAQEYRENAAKKTRKSAESGQSEMTRRTRVESNEPLESLRTMSQTTHRSSEFMTKTPMSPDDVRGCSDLSKKNLVSNSNSFSINNLENGTVSLNSNKDPSSSKSIKQLLINSLAADKASADPDATLRAVKSPEPISVQSSYNQPGTSAALSFKSSTVHQTTAQSFKQHVDRPSPLKDLNNNNFVSNATLVDKNKPSGVANGVGGGGGGGFLYEPARDHSYRSISADARTVDAAVRGSQAEEVDTRYSRKSNYEHQSLLKTAVSAASNADVTPRAQERPRESSPHALDNWNPARQEFESIKNSYGFNQANIEAHLKGFVTKSIPNICYQLKRYGRCRRPNCPFLHQAVTEEIVFSNNPKLNREIAMTPFVSVNFYEYDMIMLEYISYLGNNLFNGVIIGLFKDGKFNLTNRNNYLSRSMNNYYGKKKFLKERTTFFVKGQLVAAQYKRVGGWFRAKIVQVIQSAPDLDSTIYEVYYVDTGIYEKLGIRYVYPLHKHFLNFSYQVCHFHLSERGTSRQEFKKLVNESVALQDSAETKRKVVLNCSIIKENKKHLELAIFGYRLQS